MKTMRNVKKVSTGGGLKDKKIIASGKVEKEKGEGKSWEGSVMRDKREVIRLKNDWVTDWCSANFFASRVNMLVEAFNGFDVLGKEHSEMIDGVLKSKDYLYWEAMLCKQRAMKCARSAFFAAKELEKKGVGAEELERVKEDYFKLPIFRNDYGDDNIKEGKSASFVQTDDEEVEQD